MLSSLFDFVERASLEVAYARLDVFVDGVMISSGKMLVIDAYVHHSFRKNCIQLFQVVELSAVRCSDVFMREKLVPVAHKIPE